METNKQNIIEIINKVKQEIDKKSEDYLQEKDALDKIKDILVKLEDIKKYLNPKKNKLDDKIKNLNSLSKELSEIKFNIALDTIEDMYNIIEKNLIDGMNLKNRQGNKDLKTIYFKGAEVGKIEVLKEYRPEIKIRVKVYENEEEFDVYDPYRMYSIISFINTKFNYKEGKNSIL